VSDPFEVRASLHRQAFEGDPRPLTAAAAEPVLRETAEGFRRSIFDPCVHQTLASVWRQRALEPLGTSDEWKKIASWTDTSPELAGVLFAPWQDALDLQSAVDSATSPAQLIASLPSMAQAGLSSAVDREAAQKSVRKLDGWFASLDESIRRDGIAEGQELVHQLYLPRRLRQQWLVGRARWALETDQPDVALAMIEPAMDVSRRGLGPTNAPEAFALLAEARLRTGRSREALDALRLLFADYPEVTGVAEAIADLSVLEGMDRRGDSKEY
jgi:hypothetical protein